MAHSRRIDTCGRWRAAMAMVLLAAAGLTGCEDTEARKRADDESAAVRAERDELARQLDKTRGELKAVQANRDELRLQLRTVLSEAHATRGDREQTAGQNRRLTEQINWLTAQYDSLLEKNQVLDARIAELDKLIAQFRAPPPGPTTQPATQPDILDLIGPLPAVPPATQPDAPDLPPAATAPDVPDLPPPTAPDEEPAP